MRRSLSKVIAHIDDINRWIGIRNEMMQGKLSQGQLLNKLIEELNSAKDKLEHIYTGMDLNSQRMSDTSKKMGPVGELTTLDVKQTLRKLPRRACRINANKIWVRGDHDISNEKMMEAIDILMDEGCYPENYLSMKEKSWMQFFSLWLGK